jgi:hypothetical protein
MVNVICMKWGVKYSPEYVNTLRSMLSRHLSRPHKLICFTDDAMGIGSGVEIRPLPAMNLPAGKERGWRKLSTFASPLMDLSGPTLFLDLDIVITGSVDCFFEHPGQFCIIHDWARPWRITGNSSVYRFEAGAYPEILDFFLKNIDQVKVEVRNEQEYLTREMHKRGLVTYWPKEWCVSFKHSCLPYFPLNYFKAPALPTDAKIVVFHGNPNPPDAILGKGKGFYRYVKPTQWVAAHWR